MDVQDRSLSGAHFKQFLNMKKVLLGFFLLLSFSSFGQKYRPEIVKNQGIFANHFNPDTIKDYRLESCNCEKSLAKFRDPFRQVWPVFLDVDKDQIFYLSQRTNINRNRIVFDRIAIN